MLSFKLKFVSFDDPRWLCQTFLTHPTGGIWAMTKLRIYGALTICMSVATMAVPATATAGCYNCVVPPQPCATCYQRQVVPPQYRTVEETVMVSPGSVVAHRTPPQYGTVMVPRTVMVAPAGYQYEQIPPQYATRQRVEMVAPAREYYAPVAPRCGSCGY